jgi:hypothetical protein
MIEINHHQPVLPVSCSRRTPAAKYGMRRAKKATPIRSPKTTPTVAVPGSSRDVPLAELKSTAISGTAAAKINK